MSWEIQCIGTLERAKEYVSGCRAFGNSPESQGQINTVKSFVLSQIDELEKSSPGAFISIKCSGFKGDKSFQVRILVEKLNALR